MMDPEPTDMYEEDLKVSCPYCGSLLDENGDCPADVEGWE